MTISCLNMKRLDMPESSNGQTGRYPCPAQGQLFCGSDGYNLASEIFGWLFWWYRVMVGRGEQPQAAGNGKRPLPFLWYPVTFWL